jgi:hypothetical protein
VLSVRDSRELKAVTLALRAADRDLRNDINRATRETFNPVWRTELARRARTPTDRAVLVKGARVLAGNPPVFVTATSTRRLRGGLVPAEKWYAIEFGAKRDTVSTYPRRSVKGATHQVKRHTRHQLPPRYRKGRVGFPVAHELAPRVASLWVQLIVKRFATATEQGG